MNQRLAMRETLGLHELVNLKVVCATKSSNFANTVSDPQLRNLLQQDAQQATQQAQQLSSILSSGTGIGGRF